MLSGDGRQVGPGLGGGRLSNREGRAETAAGQMTMLGHDHMLIVVVQVESRESIVFHHCVVEAKSTNADEMLVHVECTWYIG